MYPIVVLIHQGYSMRPYFIIILAAIVITNSNASERKGKHNNRKSMHVNPTTIREIKPSSARVGEHVKIEGTFVQQNVTVQFDNIVAPILERNSHEVKVIVPIGASSGRLIVKVGSIDSVAIPFTIISDNTGITAPTTATVSQPIK